MIGHSTLWFLLINFLFSHSHFGASVDAETLQCLPLFLMPLHPLYHLPSLLFLKRLLFNSLWMRWWHSLCGRLSFSSSSSSSFMDNASSLSTLAFHTRILLHHHHPHHLCSLLCLYLDPPTFHLLLYVLLFSIIWMFVMLLDYVFVLDNMDLFWLFVMLFLYALDILELMCLYWAFDDW